MAAERLYEGTCATLFVARGAGQRGVEMRAAAAKPCDRGRRACTRPSRRRRGRASRSGLPDHLTEAGRRAGTGATRRAPRRPPRMPAPAISCLAPALDGCARASCSIRSRVVSSSVTCRTASIGPHPRRALVDDGPTGPPARVRERGLPRQHPTRGRGARDRGPRPMAAEPPPPADETTRAGS